MITFSEKKNGERKSLRRKSKTAKRDTDNYGIYGTPGLAMVCTTKF